MNQNGSPANDIRDLKAIGMSNRAIPSANVFSRRNARHIWLIIPVNTLNRHACRQTQVLVNQHSKGAMLLVFYDTNERKNLHPLSHLFISFDLPPQYS